MVVVRTSLFIDHITFHKCYTVILDIFSLHLKQKSSLAMQSWAHDPLRILASLLDHLFWLSRKIETIAMLATYVLPILLRLC